jgi:hypothetical protein
MAMHLENSVGVDGFAIVTSTEAKCFRPEGVALDDGAFVPAD